MIKHIFSQYFERLITDLFDKGEYLKPSSVHLESGVFHDILTNHHASSQPPHRDRISINPPLSTSFLRARKSRLYEHSCRQKAVQFGSFRGPRSALHSVEDYVGEAKGWTNTTYTIDLCNPIVKKGFYECPGGTRGKIKRPQKAIVEFICDANRTGLENLWVPPEPKNKQKDEEKLKEREKEGNDDEVIGVPGNDSSLQFVRLDKDKGDADILRLTWRTKYACEDGPKDDGDDKKSSHWGFFTWFIIVAFLSTAAYLIFGSWLNYNRYGARGWDLLPHGDTIRDVPYLLKDWSRRVLSTVQGGGSRGGYAAV
ncbi:hypothetical protein H4I95_11407 [Botrytis cinerea]